MNLNMLAGCWDKVLAFARRIWLEVTRPHGFVVALDGRLISIASVLAWASVGEAIAEVSG
jgi:hypothetical protein